MWRTRKKQVSSAEEQDRNTERILGLLLRRKSPFVRPLRCVRDAPFPDMAFCAREGMVTVCVHDL